MQATPYIDAFDNALRAAGDLPELSRIVSDQGRVLDEARKAKDPMTQARYQAWWAAYRALLKRARAPEIDGPLQLASEVFRNLLDSEDENLDRYLETYIQVHHEQFFT